MGTNLEGIRDLTTEKNKSQVDVYVNDCNQNFYKFILNLICNFDK